jgi:rod shape-determining protein MreB
MPGSVRVGGDKFDEAIVNYIRRNYGMLIGEPPPNRSRRKSARPSRAPKSSEMEVKGRNLSEGIPRSFTVSSNEILEALTEPLNPSSRRQDRAGADAARTGRRHRRAGMVLTGGGALLRDLDRLLMEETGLPVIVAEDPLTCVVRGSGMALEKVDKLGSIFASE